MQILFLLFLLLFWQPCVANDVRVLPFGIITAESHLRLHPYDGYIFEHQDYHFDFPPHPFLGDYYKVHQTFPKNFVLNMTGGRVFGLSGSVITQDNYLLRETAIEWGKLPESHSIFQRTEMPPLLYFPIRMAVLSSLSAHCYYHWMLDILPRLKILHDAGISPDCYYLNYSGIPFQTEALAKLNILDKTWAINEQEMHVQVNELIVPSLPSNIMCPPLWVFDFLKEKFLTSQPTSKHLRIYISRRLANTRKVINETDVVNTLAKYGFIVLELENYSVEQQALIFVSSEFIVTPHGSALTNLAFCSPGTTVIEFMPANYMNPCFWHISQQLGLKHICFYGDQYNFTPELIQKENMAINIHELESHIR